MWPNSQFLSDLVTFTGEIFKSADFDPENDPFTEFWA